MTAVDSHNGKLGGEAVPVPLFQANGTVPSVQMKKEAEDDDDDVPLVREISDIDLSIILIKIQIYRLNVRRRSARTRK